MTSRPTSVPVLPSGLRGNIGAVTLFSCAVNLLMLTVPLYMLQVYDRVLVSRSIETLLALTALAAGLLIALGLFEFVRQRILLRSANRLDSEVAPKLLRASHDLELAGRSSGTQPLRDLSTLRQFTTGSGILAFFDAPWTPLFIAVIFVLHPLLGLVALAAAVVLFALALLGEIVTRKPLEEAGRHNRTAQSVADAGLRNAEAVAAMAMRPALETRWQERQDWGWALQSRAGERSGALGASVKSVRLGFQVAMLGVGAWLVLGEAITPGAMIASSIILGRALAPVEASIGAWRGFIGARGAYQRIRDVLNDPAAEEEERLSLPAPEGRLSVEHLAAAAPGSARPILRGISFSLEPGESLAVIGPSAAGKSTLARLLVGVWPAQGGCVRLDSAEVWTWQPEELGQHLGYLPQDIELFDATVAENIARMGAADSQKVIAAARLAGAHEMILRLSDGYETRIGTCGARLSAGQRQRVGLARALYGTPKLVVLDEPNANLDNEGEAALRQAIVALRQQSITSIVIAHRPSILSVVDKVMLLRDGRIEEFGTPQEVIPKVTRPRAVASGEESQTQPPQIAGEAAQ
ncbi:type I secretion system permease/ATPase [Algihabitans sp.]|uniref:type I secretion system permease/ATPase n=1 Tax=Algihabitans sp. TaxID=2821514 RepID=UPI003BACC0B0